MSKDKVPAERKIKFNRKGDTINADVPNKQMLLSLFGTEDSQLATSLFLQAVGAVGGKHEIVSEQGRQFMLAMIEDFAPRDAIERMLSVQMAATHAGMMQVSTKMNDAGHLEVHEVYERSFNRLARTFAAQMEALRKHRNGGQSKVTVEHVTVNEGGQAIVGSIERNGQTGQT